MAAMVLWSPEGLRLSEVARRAATVRGRKKPATVRGRWKGCDCQRSPEGLRLSEVARRAATVKGRSPSSDLSTIAFRTHLLKFETHVEEGY